MNQTVLFAMLAYLNDLQRSIELSETFAEDVLALSKEVTGEQGGGCARVKMLDLARRHRVDAIKARAKMEAVTAQFVSRFGAERFEQEQAKYPARPRRSI
ncbi:hypothetical protein [Methylorubrum extorquens]|uniref:Uncharacterized protein n=1 Tax=Methylorubrum extorquens DSM 13060 TaxID=882800 RepID=H1KBY8_METEX|nr:hypothetical protein [Methylorubrum extorquens]EHP94985.1 hypothetical protein MetexDRAFT_0150 [Methylorubrum extorquens DSM 13060]